MTTLEKIRAEVEHISVWEQVSANSAIIRGGDEVKAIVLKILDKYASEECDRDCEHCVYLECPKEPSEDAEPHEPCPPYAVCPHLNEKNYSCEDCIRDFKACEDAVSRQAVLDALMKSADRNAENKREWLLLLEDRNIIRELPSVQPTKLSTRCPECGAWFGYNLKGIEQEPSVQPKAKTGRWIKSRDSYGNNHFTCSECGNDIATKYAYSWDDKYCSECGAKMVEPQESEDCDHPDKCHECDRILTCTYYKENK